MRILVVADELEPLLHQSLVGLAERGHRVRLVAALNGDTIDPVAQFRLGTDLRVAADRGEAGPLAAVARSLSALARSAAIDRHRLTTVVKRIRATEATGRYKRRRLAQALSVLSERADVVYIESAYMAAQLAPLLDRLAPVMIMCTGSDVLTMPDTQPDLARLLPVVFAQAALITCRSEDLRTAAIRRGATPGRTRVLLVGLDRRVLAPSDRPPRADGVLRLVSVGRLHWVKDLGRAVEAVAEARSRGAVIEYTIVGPDRGEGEALDIAIRDLGLDDVVVRTGSASVLEVRAAMARADALLISSVSEGMSRSAVEAMAMGLPVITTDVGGMGELISNEVEGLVVPARDTDALASAIVRLATDHDLRAAMGKRAHARSSDFDGEDHLDRLERALVDASAGRVPAA